MLRIQRQQYHFVASGGPQLLDRLRREWMPISHRYEAVRVHTHIAQSELQRPRLLIGKASNGRTSADNRIMMAHLAGARSRDQFGQRTATEASKGKVNNVGIAEQIKEEWLNGIKRVGAPELKKNYACTPCCRRHPPGSLKRTNVTEHSAESQLENRFF
jgi:hypothetical protein